MSSLRTSRVRFILLFVILTLFTCAPIWAVQYFINQDGSGHLNGAWVFTEILRGDSRYTSLFQFNFIFFPNSSGHWLLALLLLFTSAFTATKILMTVTYAGFVAAIAWLRWQTSGYDGIVTSVLIGGALGFNSLWLVGFYNFNIGLITAIFATGLYFRWKENMDIRRAAALSLLLVFAFVSHIIGFLILAAAVFVLCVSPTSLITRRKLLWSAAAFIPAAVLAGAYRLSSPASGRFVPVWKSMQDPYAISNWVDQIRGADPFIIISRRTFPFIQTESPLFAIFTPVIWIAVAVGCLFLLTRLNKRHAENFFDGRHIPFVLLAVGSILFSLVWPDHLKFQSSTGGVLRERIFLAGLVFLVPLFRIGETGKKLLLISNVLLVFVVVFQTSALWEFSIRSNDEAREFFPASEQVREGQTLAAISIVTKGKRFSSSSISSMDNYIGIGRDVLVWDNYEFGHYLFPVVAKRKEDQEFAFGLTSSNIYDLDNPEGYSDERIERLFSTMASGHQRIGTLLVWGRDERIEGAFRPYFETEPYFESGHVRLFKHK